MSDIGRLAGHLRAIGDMAARLHDEALENGDDPHMPGGDALAALADVADRDVWERRVKLREDDGDYDTTDELDDDQWPPLQTLWFWTDDLREQVEMTVDDAGWRPTILSEVRFLANPDVLDWLWNNEPRWDDLVADVRRVRAQLETTLTEGTRPQRIRVMCPGCLEVDGSDKAPRLMYVPGKKFVAEWGCTDCGETVRETRACEKCTHRYPAGANQRCKRKVGGEVCHGRIVSTATHVNHLLVRPGIHEPVAAYVSDREDDRWRCPNRARRHEYTDVQVSDARAAQLRSAGAARWVSHADTVSVMLTQGWTEDTVRSWLARDDVDTRVEKGKREAWWPDVWRVQREVAHGLAKAAAERAKRAKRRAYCEEHHGEGCWDHDGERLPGQHGCKRDALVGV